MKYQDNIKKVFEDAEEEMLSLNHPYVGSEHLLLALLKSNWHVVENFKKIGLTYDKFKKELIKIVGMSHKKSKVVLYTPLLKRIIELASSDAIEEDIPLNEGHLFRAIIEEGEGIAIRVILAMDIPLNKLYSLANNETISNIKEGTVLNDVVKDDILIGREREISELIEALLRKNKCNPLLVGKAGVGKSAIVEEFVRSVNKGLVPDKLKNAKVLNVDMGSFVAGTKYRGEFEEKVTNLLKELENSKDMILFIDEIHTLVNAGGAEGAISACDIFKPFLARGEVKLIGATTEKEYRNTIMKDKALNRRFELIEVEEPTNIETINILKGIKPIYEKFHNCLIKNNIIEELVNISNKYIFNKSNPDKAIDLLDSVCVYANCKKNLNNLKNERLKEIKHLKEESIINEDYKSAQKLCLEEQKLRKNNKVIINKEDIIEVIKRRYKVTYNDNDLKKIVNKYEFANPNEIINSIKDKKLELNIENNKLKKMCEDIYGKQLIILDGNDYMDSSSIYKLIGMPNIYNYEHEDYVLEKFKNNPFGCLYIKNVKEMCPKVKNLINRIIKEREILDKDNEIINFKNVYIILNNTEINKNIGFTI